MCFGVPTAEVWRELGWSYPHPQRTPGLCRGQASVTLAAVPSARTAAVLPLLRLSPCHCAPFGARDGSPCASGTPPRVVVDMYSLLVFFVPVTLCTPAAAGAGGGRPPLPFIYFFLAPSAGGRGRVGEGTAGGGRAPESWGVPGSGLLCSPLRPGELGQPPCDEERVALSRPPRVLGQRPSKVTRVLAASVRGQGVSEVQGPRGHRLRPAGRQCSSERPSDRSHRR